MKPVAVKVRGLRCDAPGCGYEQNHPSGDNYADWAKWLNAPCPRCGASLLTQADLDTMKIVLKITCILNFMLWPLTAFSTKKPVVYELGMDGSGSVNPKRKADGDLCPGCHSYHPLDQKCMEPRRNW